MSTNMESIPNTLLPDMNICKNFTKIEALDYLSVVIDELGKSKLPFDFALYYNLIYRISTSYFHYYHVCLDQICEMILQRNVIQSMHEIIGILTDKFNVSDKTVNLILTLLVNFSDHSEKVAQIIGTAQVLELIIDLLLDNDLSDLKNETVNRFVRLSVTIIVNFVRDINNQITYRTKKLKKLLVNYIQVDCKSSLGILSVLTLSYMVDEDESNLLDAGCNAIGCLIQEIKHSLNTDLRASGFTLSELVNGLCCVSANDNMKDRIVEEGGIPILIDILKTKVGKEIEPALRTLEKLIFSHKIKESLVHEYNIEDLVNGFIKHENRNVQKIVERILWKIKPQSKSNEKCNQSVPEYFDVFFSYSWANKDQVLSIRNDFKQYNIRVWIDDEQMWDSSIKAMANGIENSRVFIFAISSSYAKSTNCRYEAEYAYQIKKSMIPVVLELRYKPKSWVGFLVGSKIYYEFSERRNTNEVLLKLRESVKISLQKEKEASNRLGNDDDLIGKTKYVSEGSVKKSDTYRWTENDFQNWLEESKLGHLKEYFVGFNGSFIPGILKLRLNSADYLNNALKNEFNMKLIDVLMFHTALDNFDL